MSRYRELNMYRFSQKAVESDTQHYDQDVVLATLMRMLGVWNN